MVFRSSADGRPVETWRAKLALGDSAGAWNDFIARYERLILTVVRRSISDEDDVADVFAEICADLSARELALPAAHADSGRARFSTWLVTVVNHRTIDWLRRRDGRRRVAQPAGLSDLQRQIFNSVVIERRSHAESYELIQQRSADRLSFREFMKQVTATYRLLSRGSDTAIGRFFPGPPDAIGDSEPDPSAALLASECASQLSAALESLPPDERLAVQLFVVDGLAAASVAKIVGWPDAKAVYNRVSRAVRRLRPELERLGVDAADGAHE
ncbi:MAG: sigma-70 family RNA polymerase sigma factor [Gemmatimonadales bacterium]